MKLFGFDIRRASSAQDATGVVQDADRNPRIIDATTLPNGSDRWMDPSDGLDAMAPITAVKGRAYDYAVGYNMQTVPRGEELANLMQVTFPQLRFLADACEVIRILIETRKDQICGLNWQFRKRNSQRPDAQDPGVVFLNDFFAFPDRENDFDTWLRMLTEDMTVIDAASLHVARYTDSARYGQVAALEVIDGAAIKCLMDERGRRPAAPLAAYAHILHGITAVHYSTWDLIYSPCNRRSNTLYGFSPVEQIKTYAQMMIRRAALQLGYFTEGNAPDMMVPIKGTADQVAKFQTTFDAQTMGGQKTGKIIFIPADNADKVLLTKDAVLVDKFDEALFRVACAAFSESPTPFVSQVNRATAETAQEVATREGLHVVIKRISNLLNKRIIQHPMMLNMPDYEIFVAPEPLTDMQQAADIAIPAVTGGIMRVDEARDWLGLVGDPPPQPAANPQQAQVDEKTAQTDEIKEARESVGRVMRARQDAGRAQAMRHETAVADKVGNWLQRMAVKVAKRIGSVERAAGDDDPLSAITEADQSELMGIMAESTEKIIGDAALDAVGEFLDSPDVSSVRPVLREAAAREAKARGAWLVGRRLDEDGNVVAAARPEYSITDDMRDSIRSVTEEAASESWTTDKITQELQQSAGFDRSRAQTIARTEIVNAHEGGKAVGWRSVEKAGIPLVKRSILASNENHCPDCIKNAEAGWIPASADFPTGQQTAPFHPNDLCATVARKAGSES